MHRRFVLALSMALAATACTTMPSATPDLANATTDLRAAETAFAATMARRDLQAFGESIADDAVFINGGQPLRGKPAILAHWKQYFEGQQAPFSWKPETAEVNGLGTLGYTRGPVAASDGKVFAHFHTTWRRGPDGRWRVVFDNGERACTCAT